MTRAAYLVAAVAALVLSSAAQAAPVSGEAAGVLAQQIATAAANAERGASQHSQIRPDVQSAVQGLIVSSGAEPQLVLTALDQAISTCRPIGRGPSSDWMCPTSSDAFAALIGLRGMVVAALDGQEPTAAGSGPGAFQSDSPNIASANYSSF